MDHSEEAELKRYKQNIVKEIRHNRQLEEELNEMDIKIGWNLEIARNRLGIGIL